MELFLMFNLASMLTWMVVFYLCFIRRTFSIKKLVFIPMLISLTLLIIAALFFNEDKWITVEILAMHIVGIVTASVLFNYMLSNLEEKEDATKQDPQ